MTVPLRLPSFCSRTCITRFAQKRPTDRPTDPLPSLHFLPSTSPALFLSLVSYVHHWFNNKPVPSSVFALFLPSYVHHSFRPTDRPTDRSSLFLFIPPSSSFPSPHQYIYIYITHLPPSLSSSLVSYGIYVDNPAEEKGQPQKP